MHKQVYYTAVQTHLIVEQSPINIDTLHKKYTFGSGIHLEQQIQNTKKDGYFKFYLNVEIKESYLT